MKNLVRCKTCGYIIEEDKLGDVCPACGVPRKMFEPYKSRISEKRARILNLDLHPLIVHAPQSFVFFSLLFTLFFLIIPGVWSGEIYTGLKVLGALLPFVVIGAFLAGLLDGKTRFKKLSTPILKKKIVLGLIFFACSLVMFFIILFTGFDSFALRLIFTGSNLIGFGASVWLGLLGTSILRSEFPG
jgi:rubredoxin